MAFGKSLTAHLSSATAVALHSSTLAMLREVLHHSSEVLAVIRQVLAMKVSFAARASCASDVDKAWRGLSESSSQSYKLCL